MRQIGRWGTSGARNIAEGYDSQVEWGKCLRSGLQHWVLTDQDGTVAPGQTVIVVRRGRPMALRNTGDSIVLINPSGQAVDTKSYGSASSGRLFTFE